eukprot:1593363-Lingulodinium_polyedra.AAC.1
MLIASATCSACISRIASWMVPSDFCLDHKGMVTSRRTVRPAVLHMLAISVRRPSWARMAPAPCLQ